MLPGLPHHFPLPFFPCGVCTLLLCPWHQPAWLGVEAGRGSIHVQAQTTLNQPSAITPLAGGEGARGSPLFPVLPRPRCSLQTGPKQLEQDPVEQERDSTPSLGLHFFPPPCAPCRLTGPGDGPQPQLTATRTPELSHTPWGGLTLGTA